MPFALRPATASAPEPRRDASLNRGYDPKGPKCLYGTKYGFCSSNFSYGLGKYSPYGCLGPFWVRYSSNEPPQMKSAIPQFRTGILEI